MQHVVLDSSSSCHCTATIKLSLTVGYDPDELIHQNVARAGVESEHVLKRRSNNRYVCDSANVLERAHAFGISEQYEVDIGNQGRPVSAGGDVARAEIGDRRDARSLGYDARFGYLQRGSRLCIGYVIDCLSV